MSAELDTDYIVTEMGMRGFGQIGQLCSFARPDWGIVTNIGESHLELLGSRENIAKAKSELLAALPNEGVAFVNTADPLAVGCLDMAGIRERDVRIVCFSSDGKPDVESMAAAIWAEDVSVDDKGLASFTICSEGFGDEGDGRCRCSLAVPGLHNVSNACCAVATGLEAGLSLEQAVGAAEASLPESGRQNIMEHNGVTIIDDAYNASPSSVSSALDTLFALKVEGRRIAVLGDMMELGEATEPGHAACGEKAAGIADLLVCVGELSKTMARSAADAGKAPDGIVCLPDADAALQYLAGIVGSGDAVLVKASHSIGLEKVVEGLVAA